MALPLPAGRVPLRSSCARENADAAATSGSTSSATPAILDDDRFFDVTDHLRQGRARTTSASRIAGDQPRPGRRAAAPAAAGLVAQHLGVGPRRPASTAAPAAAADAVGRRAAGRRVRARLPRPLRTSPPRARPRCCSATTRPTRSHLFGAGDEPVAVHQGRHQQPGRARRHARRSTRRLPAPRPRSGTDFDAVEPGETVDGAAAAVARRRRTSDTFGAGFDAGPRRPRSARPTSSTPRHRTPACPTRTGTSPAGPTPACCGASSSTATTSPSGSTATRRSPAPPSRAGHRRRATRHWRHLALADVISMPDEWEYPWFAAWDLAFHAIPLAHVDPDFAKEQLVLMCREWAMHPNGQLPAYEWEFGDVNPPVHAWAAWHVYRIDGYRDRDFLDPGVHQAAAQLLLVGQPQGRRRLQPVRGRLPRDGQHRPVRPVGAAAARATGWSSPTRRAGWRSTASRCSRSRWSCRGTTRRGTTSPPSSSSTSSSIAAGDATPSARSDVSLWDEDDGFFYDVLVSPDGTAAARCGCGRWSGCCRSSARPRCPPWVAERAARRHRPAALAAAAPARSWSAPLLSPVRDGRRRCCCRCVDPERLRRILQRMFDADEFLSPYGIRSLSAAYRGRPSRPTSAGSERVDRVRAGRVAHRPVRRQLQLARAGLVPGERAAGRQAAHATAGTSATRSPSSPDRVRATAARWTRPPT